MTTGTLEIKVDGSKAERSLSRLDRSMGKLDGAAKRTQGSAGKLSGAFGKLSVAAKLGAAAIGTALVLGLKSGIKSAIAFETSMAEISTLLSGDVAQATGELKSGIEEMALLYGGDLTTNAKAAYAIISAGASDSAEAIGILDAANKLAIGGVTSVETAADGLTSALNAYGAGAEDATAFSDTMFVAMKAGKTTIGELSAVVGSTAPIASQLGVSFDELEAAIAALTTTGLKTAVAGTQIQAAFTSILKPTKEAATEAERLGLSFNTQALEAKGLSGFLDDVRLKTGGNKESMAKLFGSVEAVKAVMALTGGQAEKFAEILEQMKGKVGATDEALKIMQDTFAFEWDRLKQKFVSIGLAIGDVLLPMLKSAVRWINNTIESVRDLLGLGQEDRLSAKLGEINEKLAEMNKIPQRWKDQHIKEITADTAKLNAEWVKVNEQLGKLRETENLTADYFDWDIGIVKETPPAIEKVSEAAVVASEALEGVNDELSAWGGPGEPIHTFIDKTTTSLNTFTDSLLDNQENADLVGQKHEIVKDLFDQGRINAEIYADALNALGIEGEASAGIMEQGFKNFIENTQKAFGDLVYDGFKTILGDGENAFKAFTDTLLDMFLRMVANMVAAWATKGIAQLFTGGGFGGFSLGGAGGGTGNAITSLASIASGAKAAYAGVVKLAGGFKTTAVATGSAKTTALGYKFALEESATAAYELGSSTAAAQGELAALSESTAGAQAANSGWVSGLKAAAPALALVAGYVALSAKNSRDQAAAHAEVTAKFAESTDVIRTSSLAFGTWGDEGLIQLNSGVTGAQNLAIALRSADVEIKEAGQGAFLLGSNIETARQISSKFNSETSAALEEQITHAQTLNGNMGTQGDIAEANLVTRKEMTAEWAKSLEIVNDTNFDKVSAEIAKLHGVGKTAFEMIVRDGIVTTDELISVFGAAASDITSKMGGASSITVSKLLQILGAGKTAANGISDGFSSAASDMTGDFQSSTSTIQGAIDKLHGVDIQSTHTVVTIRKAGQNESDFATGTPPGGFIVPAGFPNDSFSIGTTSKERVTVETPAQQRQNDSKSAGGNTDMAKTNAILNQIAKGTDKNAQIAAAQVSQLIDLTDRMILLESAVIVNG